MAASFSSTLNLRRKLHAATASSEPVDFFALASCLSSLLALLGEDVPVPPAVFRGEIGPKLKLAEQLIAALQRAGVGLDVQAHQLVVGTDIAALALVVDGTAQAAAQRRPKRVSPASSAVSTPRASPRPSATAMQGKPPSQQPPSQQPPSQQQQQQHQLAGPAAARIFQTLEDKVQHALAQRRALLVENAALRQQLAESQATSPADLVVLVREVEALKARERELKRTCLAERVRLEALASGSGRGVLVKPRAVRPEPVLKCEVYQFQRRFNELYGEMANIAEEERAGIDTFNMLSTRLRLLQTETQTLHSLLDGYTRSRDHSRMRDELAGQFRSIVADLDARVGRARAKRDEALARKQAQQAELARLMTVERDFFEAVRELHDLVER